MGAIYNQIKDDVNALGNGVQNAVRGYLRKNNKKEFKDRKGNTIQMAKVGISTGVFIPVYGKDKDWISLADKVALEKAKEVNMPQKNGVAVYYNGHVYAQQNAKSWGF